MTTSGERIVSVEVEVKGLKQQFTEHKDDTSKQFEDINNKLDDLLALRNRGMGVFWLVSSLVGTGLIGGMVTTFDWLFGK